MLHWQGVSADVFCSVENTGEHVGIWCYSSEEGILNCGQIDQSGL